MTGITSSESTSLFLHFNFSLAIRVPPCSQSATVMPQFSPTESHVKSRSGWPNDPAMSGIFRSSANRDGRFSTMLIRGGGSSCPGAHRQANRISGEYYDLALFAGVVALSGFQFHRFGMSIAHPKHWWDNKSNSIMSSGRLLVRSGRNGGYPHDKRRSRHSRTTQGRT